MPSTDHDRRSEASFCRVNWAALRSPPHESPSHEVWDGQAAIERTKPPSRSRRVHRLGQKPVKSGFRRSFMSPSSTPACASQQDGPAITRIGHSRRIGHLSTLPRVRAEYGSAWNALEAVHTSVDTGPQRTDACLNVLFARRHLLQEPRQPTVIPEGRWWSAGGLGRWWGNELASLLVSYAALTRCAALAGHVRHG